MSADFERAKNAAELADWLVEEVGLELTQATPGRVQNIDGRKPAAELCACEP
jgi:hypothetical protein